ncbi:MAG: aldo/keto reductase [Thermoplasmata archaeon]|nr:aldo/keto reductase [Thermoplasmata archaeon]
MKRARSRGPAVSAPGELPPGFPLGPTGRIHPAIGLGLWNLGRWTPPEEAKLKPVISAALAADVPWLDTAEVYGGGRSEQLLGDALAMLEAGRTRPFLSSKLSYEHLRASQVRPSLLGTLRRLGLPSIDLYLIHFPNPKVPLAETLEPLAALREEGRIGAIGVSNFSLEELEAANAALGDRGVVANQVPYNLLEREEGEPVAAYCRAHRIVLEAYSPLARGLLAGRYLRSAPRAGDPRSGRGLFERSRWPESQRRARALQALAEEAKLPLATIALQWLISRGAAPLVGAGSIEQLTATMEAARQRPAKGVLERADRIARGDAD